MKKLMALVLSFGLVLLGAMPAMAAGQGTQYATASSFNSDTSFSVELSNDVPAEFYVLEDEELLEITGQKVIRSFQDFVETVGKAAAAAYMLGDDWSGNILNDIAGITAAVSAGIDVIDTVGCYVFGKHCEK